MVYVDKLKYNGADAKLKISCHMVADTVEELHKMAGKLGLSRGWFQPKSFPHYDITAAIREWAVLRGAKEVGARELVGVMRRVRGG